MTTKQQLGTGLLIIGGIVAIWLMSQHKTISFTPKPAVQTTSGSAR